MGGGVEQGNEDASGGGLMFGNFAPVNWSLSQLEEQVRFCTTYWSTWRWSLQEGKGARVWEYRSGGYSRGATRGRDSRNSER
jgi:hypothetical protein